MYDVLPNCFTPSLAVRQSYVLFRCLYEYHMANGAFFSNYLDVSCPLVFRNISEC